MKLIVRTHQTQVQTRNVDLLRGLDKKFAISVPGHWFSKSFKMGFWDGKKHFFNKRDGTIPTGLLPLVQSFLQDVPYEMVDLRPLPQEAPELVTKLGEFDLDSAEYNYQAKAARQALEKQRGVLSIATNGGKLRRCSHVWSGTEGIGNGYSCYGSVSS
jgi:hypothetical protein